MDGGGRLLRSMSGSIMPSVLRSSHAGPHVAAFTTAKSFDPGPRERSPRRRAFVVKPIEQRIPRGIGTFLTLGLFAATISFGIMRGGHYDALVQSFGPPDVALARAGGFGLDRITISGLNAMTAREVLQAAGIDERASLFSVDAEAIRAQLLAMPLVQDATVRKLFPDGLQIALTEREPYALWQRNGEVFVISADGKTIDTLRDDRFLRLPLVVGEGANERAVAFAKLLDEQPSLKPVIRAGILVGQRRWTLKLENGIDVRLPEDHVSEAMAKLASLVKDKGLLNKDVLSVDLRKPDRVVLRLTEEGAAALAEAQKNKAKARGNAT
jgi:cell division protein FtsQ